MRIQHTQEFKTKAQPILPGDKDSYAAIIEYLQKCIQNLNIPYKTNCKVIDSGPGYVVFDLERIGRSDLGKEIGDTMKSVIGGRFYEGEIVEIDHTDKSFIVRLEEFRLSKADRNKREIYISGGM